MIDVTCEELLSLNEARKRLPQRRQGKRPDVSTMYRWGLRGCKGVVLETVQIGGTRCTSVEALARFFARLSGQTPSGAAGAAVQDAAATSLSKRKKSVARELEAEGI